MLNTASIRTGHHKAGKCFVLLFNRVLMYGPGHPFSAQAAEDFYYAIQELLKTTSPVVLIYTRDQFFLEDEALDRNLNYSKMSSHFKKAKVTSISIQKDLQKREVEDFVKVFLDTRRYPTAEQMRKAAAALKVNNIKINHIFYQKVTEDDQVVAKSETERTVRRNEEVESTRQHEEALSLIAGNLLMEELDQNLSVKTLLADPKSFSRSMVAKDLSELQAGDQSGGRPSSIHGQLIELTSRIKQVLPDGSPLALSDLADALVKMKSELFSAIEAQKSLGFILDQNNDIRKQAETVTDAVILELIRKEYDKGNTSVERLAFVLQRIVPQPEELKRLLPSLKACLMNEGMPLSVFAELIKRLGEGWQNEEIVQAINQGAEDIGVDGSDLIGRLRSDPSGFSRFLYLASEIEKEAGSSKPLCDILVDYLDRMGSRLLNRSSGTDKAASDDMLRKLVAQYNASIVTGLRSGPADPQFVNEIEERLKQRLESSVQAIRAELADNKTTSRSVVADSRTLLQSLEDSLPDDHELKRLLQQVRADLKEQGLDENDLQRVFERIEHAKKKDRKTEKELDEIVFSRKHTLALLEIETSRALRYGTELSGIAFSILRKASPKRDEGHDVSSAEAMSAILRKLRDKLRSTDWIGTLSKTLFIAVLPMTTLKEAHLTSRRLLKALNADPVRISGRSVPFKLAGSVIHYDTKRMPGIDAFIRFAQNEHMEMTHRLRNLQELM